MILFGWKKRIALSMCIFLFLGSISYLTGVVSSRERDTYNDFQSYRDLDFFSRNSFLRIFNKPSQAKIAWESKKEKNLINSEMYPVNRRQFIDHLKKYVKSRIIFKLQSMRPQIPISEKDFIGYFLYKWIKKNMLLVTIKFKLLSFNKLSWYYDQFSVTLE